MRAQMAGCFEQHSQHTHRLHACLSFYILLISSWTGTRYIVSLKLSSNIIYLNRTSLDVFAIPQLAIVCAPFHLSSVVA